MAALWRALTCAVALAGASEAAHAEPPTAPGAAREGRHVLSAGYLVYNLNWPGVELGYGYRAVESPERRHALVVGVDVGTYVWPRHDVGVYALPRVGWRGRHRVGLEGSLDVRFGYLHTIPASPSFQVIDGEVERGGGGGYPMWMASPQLGVGWFFPRAGVAPTVHLGAMLQHPVFDALVIRFHVSVGLEVRL